MKFIQVLGIILSISYCGVLSTFTGPIASGSASACHGRPGDHCGLNGECWFNTTSNECESSLAPCDSYNAPGCQAETACTWCNSACYNTGPVTSKYCTYRNTFQEQITQCLLEHANITRDCGDFDPVWTFFEGLNNEDGSPLSAKFFLACSCPTTAAPTSTPTVAPTSTPTATSGGGSDSCSGLMVDICALQMTCQQVFDKYNDAHCCSNSETHSVYSLTDKTSYWRGNNRLTDCLSFRTAYQDKNIQPNCNCNAP